MYLPIGSKRWYPINWPILVKTRVKKNAITIKLSTIDENIFNNETGACFSTSTSGGKRGTQRLNAKDMKRCSLDDAKLPTTFIHADWGKHNLHAIQGTWLGKNGLK